MPAYEFTIADPDGIADAHTIRVTGSNAKAVADWFSGLSRHAVAHRATVTDPIPIDPARADGQQQDANRELGAHPV